MVHKSRIAPGSDLQTVAKGRKPARGRVHAALRQVAVFALLAALVYATPALVGPNFLHDLARGVMVFAVAAGDWVRAVLLALFQNIPVR